MDEDRDLVIRDADDTITHVQGIVLDVTELRLAEIKLRENEERYRILVESAEEAVFAMDAAGLYLFMNAAAAAVGGRPEDFVGKTMWDAFPKDIAERQLREAHKKLVNAREEERRRVAGELLDSVNQDLVTVQLAIQEAASIGRGKLDTAPQAGRGLGLATMHDRARAAGGGLTISSKPGRTCVKTCVPLTHPDE